MYDIDDFATMTISELVAYRKECVNILDCAVCDFTGDRESHLAIQGAEDSLIEIDEYLAKLKHNLSLAS